MPTTKAPPATPVLSFDPSSITDGAIAHAPTVPVDLQTLIGTRLQITGDSRSGKSRMVRQLLEQTYGHVPHLVIDPEGDFATLRERFDYLLVGRGGELAADVATAAQLASSLFQLRASAILDLSDLKPKVQREYVAAFVGQLTEIHQSEGHPTLVVVDECQFFGPEGGKAESHDALWNLSRRGGKRGLCLVAIAPRLSELSKEIAGGLQNRLIFRTTLDVDVDRSAKQLGFRTREAKSELERLARGECFVYGPAIGDHAAPGVHRVRGVAETQTTHPDITKGARPATPPARESLNALVEQLRQFEAKAKEELREVDRLQRRVQELETTLEQAKATPILEYEAVKSSIATAVAAAVQEERVRQDRLRMVLQGAARQAHECMRAAMGHLEGVDETVEHKWLSAPVASVEAAPPRPDPEAAPPRKAKEGKTAKDPDALLPFQQAMLDALAWIEREGAAAGAECTKAQLGALIGLPVENRMFRMHFSVLRRRELVREAADGTPATTARGWSRADRARAWRLADVHQTWRAKLKNEKQLILFDRLIAAGGNAIAKKDLARAIGVDVANRIFRMHLSVVRKLGVINDVGGHVAASPLLFPKGLR